MGLFGKFFSKKEVEKAEVELEKLPAWYSERSSQIEKSMTDEINSIFNKIKENIQGIEEKSKILADAKLKNESIPLRAKQIMEGNRSQYIQFAKVFTDRIKIPEKIVFSEIPKFCEETEKNLDVIGKASHKSYYILQEFFSHESSEIASLIKSIDNLVKELKQKISDERFSLSQTLKERIDSLKKRRDSFEKIKKQIEEDKTELSSAEKNKETVLANIEKLKTTPEHEELLKMEKEKEELENELKKQESEILNLFSPLERALSKYSKIALDNVKLMEKYISEPNNALKEDSDLKILEIIEKIKQNIDSLELKDQKKEKTLEVISSINKDLLVNLREKEKELKENYANLKKKIRLNNAMNKQDEMKYKLEHFEQKIARLMKNIDELSKKTDEEQLAKLKQNIAENLLKLLEVEVTIK